MELRPDWELEWELDHIKWDYRPLVKLFRPQKMGSLGILVRP
jgi:hypothetical protein